MGAWFEFIGPAIILTRHNTDTIRTLSPKELIYKIIFTVISCPPFNVTNGTVDIISLQYLGEATIMCDPSHWAENGEQNLTVTCQADKTWNINATCKGTVESLLERLYKASFSFFLPFFLSFFRYCNTLRAGRLRLNSKVQNV